MTRACRFAVALLAVAMLAAGLAAEPAIGAEAPQWSGSLKSLNFYSEADQLGLFPESAISSNRLRLNLGWNLDRRLRLEASLDHQLLWTDPAELPVLPASGVNRAVDLEKVWRHADDWDSRLQVDHLNLRYRGPSTDLVIGRQAVGFGRIVIFSPLDIIAPFPPDALDTDIRPGVDALRISSYYGLDGQIGGVLVGGDENRYHSLLLTWSDNRGGVDLLAITGVLRDRAMLGLGLAGSLGTLGLKAEAAIYEGRRENHPPDDLYADFAVGGLEAWYRFDNGLTLITQYLYNGPGATDPQDYPAVAASAPLREGLTALLGRHYLLAAPSYQLHPLATLDGLLIWNLEDSSLLIRPTLKLEPMDNFSLDLFWTFLAGKEPQIVEPFLPAVPRSEFGLRGQSGGLFLRFYF